MSGYCAPTGPELEVRQRDVGKHTQEFPAFECHEEVAVSTSSAQDTKKPPSIRDAFCALKGRATLFCALTGELRAVRFRLLARQRERGLRSRSRADR
jgi:hypothetical protein